MPPLLYPQAVADPVRLGAAALLCVISLTASAAPDGRALFADPRKGNCNACHKVPNDSGIKAESTIGPALENMRQRFPDRQRLIATIADATRTNPNTIMPPYGRHRILSDAEIDAVAQYVEGL